jgi:hypothetical protein
VQSSRSAISASSCASRIGSISTSSSRGCSRVSSRCFASSGRSGARSEIRIELLAQQIEPLLEVARQRVTLARLHRFHVVARLADHVLEQRPRLFIGQRGVLPREQIGQRGERLDADRRIELVALAQLLEQTDVAIGDGLVELQHLARLARARPRDRQVELAARVALLDEQPDLVLERRHEPRRAHRHLAVAVVHGADLRREALAVALELGRAIAGHAADHPSSRKVATGALGLRSVP